MEAVTATAAPKTETQVPSTPVGREAAPVSAPTSISAKISKYVAYDRLQG